MGAVKVAIEAYRQYKNEQKLKKRLLRETLDYTYLQKLINAVSSNEKTMIIIKMTDGTVLEIKKQYNSQNIMRDPYQERIMEVE